ncbi:hypothetical protein F2Q70_00013181 [Brassica cretica]|uniref:Uncharacterized protein n=1 Tax=Brassica cretica TaxID=69181 RepID=A0A8S9LS94_BRACR|nr:hypothetical protein F2Q70_00013181 [Brassica cretica]
MSKLGSVVLETSHEAFLTVNTEPSGGKRETSSKLLENPCPHSFGSNCTTAETPLLLQSNRREFCFFLPDFVIAYDETDCYSFLPYLHLSKVNKISWFHRIESTLADVRIKPRDLTLEPTDRAVALPNPSQAFLFLGPCGMVKSILYRNRRPAGRLERLVDESPSVVLSAASSRGFIAPFDRCVAGRILEYFRLRSISRGYSDAD